MKFDYNLFNRNMVVAAGVLGAAAGLVLTACDRHDTSTPQGAADKLGEDVQKGADKTRDAIKDATNSSSRSDLGNSFEKVANKTKDALRRTGEAAKDAAKDAGRTIQKTGEEIKDKVSSGN